MSNCDNCPNTTDGKCCHQAIRTDDHAWHREFEYLQRKQEARKPKHQPLHGVLVDLPKEV